MSGLHMNFVASSTINSIPILFAKQQAGGLVAYQQEEVDLGVTDTKPSHRRGLHHIAPRIAARSRSIFRLGSG